MVDILQDRLSSSSSKHASESAGRYPELDLVSKFESAIREWEERSGSRFKDRENFHLLAFLASWFSEYSPREISHPIAGRSIALPRYISNTAPGTFLLTYSPKGLGLFETSVEFRSFHAELVQRLAIRNTPGRRSLALEKSLSPVWFNDDWTNPNSPILSSWVRVLSKALKSRAEGCGIKALQSTNEARLFAFSLRFIFQSQLLSSLTSLLAGEESSVAHPSRFYGTSASAPVLSKVQKFNLPSERIALAQFVFAVPFLSTSSAHADSKIQEEVIQGVAERRPVIELSSALLDCPKAILSRVKACSLAHLSDMIESCLPEDPHLRNLFRRIGLSYRLVTRFLRKVPVSNIPRFDPKNYNEDETSAFAKVVSAAIQVAFPNPRNVESDKGDIQAKAELLSVEALGAGTRGRWELIARQLNQIKPGALRHVKDMIHAVSRATILPFMLLNRDISTISYLTPGAITDLAYSLTLAILAEKLGVTGLVESSERWHQAGSHVLLHVKRKSWSNLVDEVVAPNGLRLIPLSNSIELVNEGNAMRHCVGSYAPFCLQGRSRIYSIRDEKGVGLSTLEVLIERGGSPRLVEGQNFGHFNSKPKVEALEAGRWFVEAVNRGEVPADWAALRSDHSTSDSSICGFDIEDPGAWQKEYTAIIHCIPKAISGTTIEEFIEINKIRQILTERLKS